MKKKRLRVFITDEYYDLPMHFHEKKNGSTKRKVRYRYRQSIKYVVFYEKKKYFRLGAKVVERSYPKWFTTPLSKE